MSSDVRGSEYNEGMPTTTTEDRIAAYADALGKEFRIHYNPRHDESGAPIEGKPWRVTIEHDRAYGGDTLDEAFGAAVEAALHWLSEQLAFSAAQLAQGQETYDRLVEVSARVGVGK